MRPGRAERNRPLGTNALRNSLRSSGREDVSVEFVDEIIPRFGETVVMFSHDVAVTENAIARSAQHGLATEVYVRTSGRWVHASWHLDRAPRSTRAGRVGAEPTPRGRP